MHTILEIRFACHFDILQYVKWPKFDKQNELRKYPDAISIIFLIFIMFNLTAGSWKTRVRRSAESQPAHQYMERIYTPWDSTIYASKILSTYESP